MEQNPYRSPSNYARANERQFSLLEGRLLAAVLAVAASTIGGCPIGVIGFAVLASMPRESRPSCGNAIIDPMASAGMAAGFLVGLWFSWRRICRQVSAAPLVD